MRLAPLLASLSDEQLDRLAIEHVRTDQKLARPQLCNFLEGALLSYRYIHDFVANRQPPTFALLSLLLDAPGYQLPTDGFRDRVIAETRRIADLIDAGDLLARDDQLRLYRRAMYEARRNDLDLNASETAVLDVLRRETGIAQVEHYLIEHHQDFREFWDKDDCFEHEQLALVSAGLVFVRNVEVVIPEEIAPAISQTLGLDMPSDSARRLFGYLSNSELAIALEAAGSRTSGSKEARLERLITERIQPRVVLSTLSLSTLRDICREADASMGGNKDDLIERIISHFAQRKDQRVEIPPEPQPVEPRALDQQQFATLFGALKNHELSDILRRFEHLRQSGSKDIRIRTLWESHLSEQTLLGELMNRELENVLYRLGVKIGGSKIDRIDRIISHFATNSPAHELREPLAPDANHAQVVMDVTPEIAARQEVFRQRASSPQASLQPWLEELLEAPNSIRCYATEDPNPTKQLKNKLSQAAAAEGGLLVLMLAGESAFSKAREALIERWMANTEWPKGVAAVALAYPLGEPTIRTIVERHGSRWASKIEDSLFPGAEAVCVGDTVEELSFCAECQHPLPEAARFCPNCGVAIS